jgi:hypothetical protein
MLEKLCSEGARTLTCDLLGDVVSKLAVHRKLSDQTLSIPF